MGQYADPNEHGDREDRHRDKGACRVLRLRRLECRDAVRHRLDTGHGRAAVRERRQKQKRCQRSGARIGRQREIERHEMAQRERELLAQYR